MSLQRTICPRQLQKSNPRSKLAFRTQQSNFYNAQAPGKTNKYVQGYEVVEEAHIALPSDRNNSRQDSASYVDQISPSRPMSP